MTTEDILATAVMGFILGLFAFGASYVRVRYWSKRFRPGSSTAADSAQADRHTLPHTIQPTGARPRSWLDHYIAFEWTVDLVWVALVVAMLVYGSVVAPRLRYILATAIVTTAACWWVWLTIRKWLRRP